MKQKLFTISLFAFFVIVSPTFAQTSATTGQLTAVYGGVTYNVNPTTGAVTSTSGSSVGTLNLSTGIFSDPNGGTIDIGASTGTTFSSTNSGGVTVSTTMDGHPWNYQVGMYDAGTSYANAYTNSDTAGMTSAITAANNQVAATSGGTQTTATIVSAGSNTYYYGCINSQNSSIILPTTATIGEVYTDTTGVTYTYAGRGTYVDNSGSTYTYNTGTVGGGNGETVSTELFAPSPTPVNGVCGGAIAIASRESPTSRLCDVGYTMEVVKTPGQWAWTCEGTDGGSPAYCSTSRIVDGICGPANEERFVKQPDPATLCGEGQSSVIEKRTEGGWEWTCNGVNGGNGSPLCIAKSKAAKYQEI